jgi:hypothetical protein
MKEKISTKTLRDFGLLIAFAFPILIGFLFPYILGHAIKLWTLWIGIISLTLSLFVPRLLFIPYKVWMKLGFTLGWINSRIILGIVFFVVLFPLAILMKFTGYDPLRKKNISAKTFKEIKKENNINLKRIF